jgi:cell division protein FtsB
MALYLSFSQTNKAIKRSKNKMGITELIVIVFLAVLGFLAYNNSKKVARELRRLGADK